MKTYKAHGIVLKRVNFGEADRKITLYTDRLGKILLLAKGSRRPLGKLTAAVNLFNEIDFMATQGRSFDVLTEARIISSRHHLGREVASCKTAFWMAELLDKLINGREPNPELYNLLNRSLQAIDEEKSDLALDYFIYQALCIMGYKPELDRCVECGKTLEIDGRFIFSPLAGGVVEGECREMIKDGRTIGVNAIKAIRCLENPWHKICKFQINKATSDELREHLKNLVETILQKPVRADRI